MKAVKTNEVSKDYSQYVQYGIKALNIIDKATSWLATAVLSLILIYLTTYLISEYCYCITEIGETIVNSYAFCVFILGCCIEIAHDLATNILLKIHKLIIK